MIPPPPKKVDILPVARECPVVIQTKSEVPTRPAEPAYRSELPPMDWQPAPIIPTLIEAAKIFVRSGQLLSEPPQRSEVPLKPEAKEPLAEEKSSKPEEKSSELQKKRKVRYEGEGGRIHTEAQIDEILDFYLMTGELPVYVSERQRYDYRHHERLPERKELLEGRGIQVNIDLSSSTRRAKNVIPINGTKVQRKRSTGS